MTDKTEVASDDAAGGAGVAAMRLQLGPEVADYVSAVALLSGPADSERDARAIEDLPG